MPDPTTSDPRAAAVDALIAAGATDEEITSILTEKFGGWRPGADSLSAVMSRPPQVISDAPQQKSPPTQAEPSWAGLPFIKGLISNLNPTTIRDNLLNSGMLQRAAHPETAGDVATLLIPSGIEGAVSGAKTLSKSLKGAITPGSKVKDWPRQLAGRIHDRWTDPLDLGERAMRDAPLHQQMNILEGPPVRAEAVRTGTPPYQPSPTPFHEKPLYQQMSDLPETPAPILGRTASPPHTPQAEAVPFHERPLYQQMDDLPQTEAPVVGRSADPPHQPTATQSASAAPASPSAAAPILRKPTQTPEEILNQMLQESMTAETPTRVSAAPEPTATATGRPSVTAAEQADIEARAAGRGSPRVEDITPDATPDLGTTSGFEPTTMSDEAVAARKARAGGGEPAPTQTAEPVPTTSAEPSAMEQQLRDSVVEEARKKRQQETVNSILDYHGRNNMPGVSRKQAAQVDTRMAPHGLSGEAAERIAGKVSEGLTSPEARQSLIEYYNSARDDLFKNRLGQAMRDAGILPPQ